MSKYLEELRELFNPSVDRRHDEWMPFMAFSRSYGNSSNQDKEGYINAIRAVFQNPSEDPRMIADLIYVSNFLYIKQLRPDVESLKETMAGSNEIVAEQITYYLANTSCDDKSS